MTYIPGEFYERSTGKMMSLAVSQDFHVKLHPIEI